jgi:hypothetical protein
MELSYLLLLGSLSGLVSVLAHAVLASLFDMVRRRPAALPVHAEHSQLQLTDALLHMLCGTGLGLLFWLSWGLAAIVAVPWWVRGVTFAGLGAMTLALPAILDIAWTRGLTQRMTLLIASRWATTFLVAGLACAWSWERSV